MRLNLLNIGKRLLASLLVLVVVASCAPTDGGGGVTNPSWVRADLITLTTVALEWTNVPNVDGYVLERKQGGGSYTKIYDGGATLREDTVVEGQTYTYLIKAVKGGVSSTGVEKVVEVTSKGTPLSLTSLTSAEAWFSKVATDGNPSTAVNAASNVTKSSTNLIISGTGEALYYLGGGCSTFSASISGSGTFKVFADEKQLWSNSAGTATGDLTVVGKQMLSLVFEGSGPGTWTNPVVYCSSTPSKPDSKYLQGSWGAVFDWGDGVARGTPGTNPRPNGYYERGYIVPTHVANLPDGRIVSWAAWREFTYGRKEETPPFIDQTAGYIWNPTANSFVATDNPTHDMFCAGLAMTADGRIFAAGGGSTLSGGAVAPSQYKASFFDFRANAGAGAWKESRPGGANAFKVDHWYGSAVALPDNRLFVAGGSGGNNLPSSVEIGGANDGASWTTFTGADSMFPLTEGDMDIGSSITIGGKPINFIEWGEARGWYPFLHVAPDGTLFQSGPQPTLKNITINATTVKVDTAAGLPSKMRTWGNSIMFDEGKILLSGGTPIRGTGAYNTAFVFDITSKNVQVTATPNMRFRRAFQNGVVLPTGDVLIIGGNNSGKQFTDGIPVDSDGYLENDPNSANSTNANYRWPSDIKTETVFTPELYSPDKNTWRDLSNMKEPRNYHSVGILLQDGRVLAAGGGLCGDNPTDSSNPTGDDSKDCNHPNGEIFEPPYLFSSNGSLANRPVIQTAPTSAGYGQTFNVTLSSLGDGTEISKFSMIKLSAVTHSMNTDVRYLEYSAEKQNMTGSSSNYTLTTVGGPNAKNILTPGYYFLFAVNNKGVPSVAKIIQVQ